MQKLPGEREVGLDRLDLNRRRRPKCAAGRPLPSSFFSSHQKKEKKKYTGVMERCETEIRISLDSWIYVDFE